MIEQALTILVIIALVGNVSYYILLSCENSSHSVCGNAPQLKQSWEYERTRYMSPLGKWLEWINTMISWGA